MSAQQIDSLKIQAIEAFGQATSTRDLYELKVQFLGKNGSLSGLMREMGKLPKEERPAFGQKVNEAREAVEAAYASREQELKLKEVGEQLAKERWDLTLPGPLRALGTAHPVYRTTEEIVRILSRLGYSVRLGPMIEKDRYNFEALNIPADHPARDMQDTFYMDPTHVLRTHTSPIQIHTMENEKPPLRVIGVGSVFRVDSDISHLPNFHQIEGLLIDRRVSMADLRGTIAFFVREFFGADLKTRFRPSFFPFTEPSAEVDCSCPICKGKGCAVCKQSGWIEIGGSGLVNPNVIRMAGLEYPDCQGFAFGFGIERMAMIKYGIPDIRMFPENDVRFLGQFSS
jgi:phenylalanyl-tRNA synthetase alpha chain